QLAAIHGVGQRPGTEREQQDRHQLEQRERGDGQRRPGEDEDLVRQGDPSDLGADSGDDLPGPQPAEVPVEPEGRDGGGEGAEPAVQCARRQPSTRAMRNRSVWPWLANDVSSSSSPVTTSTWTTAGWPVDIVPTCSGVSATRTNVEVSAIWPTSAKAS